MDIRKLDAYHDNSRGKYRGITKKYFPRWTGWKLIEDGRPFNEIDDAVIEFYLQFFIKELYLEDFSNRELATACLNFATKHGKKKLIQKLQHIVGLPLTGKELIQGFNSMGSFGEYKLLLEFMDFYLYTKDNNIEWIIDTYRKIS